MEPSRLTVLSLMFVSLACTSHVREPGKFRSGIFLHHSTGKCIWGPNGSSTSVPREISRYNAQHGLIGGNSVGLEEKWWPAGPDNEWATWHQIFNNENPAYDIGPYLEKNSIVMIKSCFPSSNMGSVGSSTDTLTPEKKSLYNFKWHWRSIISAMQKYPQDCLIIWTNAPQVASQTTDSEAALANAACRWAKDTLATGLDPEFGSFPDNVFVFDLFHKLADETGKLPLTYAVSGKDSHPNASATTLVAPQLVKEIFDATITYESILHTKTAR